MTSFIDSFIPSSIRHNLHERQHDAEADAARERQRDDPRQDDVAEERPVDVLTRAEAPDEHHRADLTVRRRDGDADVGGDEHCQRRADLNAEAAVIKERIMIAQPATDIYQL